MMLPNVQPDEKASSKSAQLFTILLYLKSMIIISALTL